jgi:hypothetical protein
VSSLLVRMRRGRGTRRADPAFVHVYSYSIQRDNDSGYRVRVTHPDGNWHVVVGFADEWEAENWIEEQIQIVLRDPNRTAGNE